MIDRSFRAEHLVDPDGGDDDLPPAIPAATLVIFLSLIHISEPTRPY